MCEIPPIELWHLCLALKLDYKAFQDISAQAGISVETFKDMLIGEKPIDRQTAIRVLNALPRPNGYIWTLENVKVALIQE